MAAAAIAGRTSRSVVKSSALLCHRHHLHFCYSPWRYDDIGVDVIKSLAPIKEARSKPPEEACVLKTEDGWSPPQVINPNDYEGIYLNDFVDDWLVKLKYPHPISHKYFTEKQMYNLSVNTLARFIPKEEAKKKIYAISDDPYVPGFCATIDSKIVEKLRDLKFVNRITPDYLRDARMMHPDTYPMGQYAVS